uniref:chloride channel protein n=1 Tax=Altererythrobacter segetis TaxID=1104773 RepID=UPI00140AF6F3|nr:chloride channel protein [Altererythrobacter segetis]
MLLLAAMALATGTGGALSAWALLHLIGLTTNLLWYHRLSWAMVSPADAATGPLTILIPVLGSLVIGAMARFGSDKIRGHGIPEAIEAILYGESKLTLKVALLKPISSAISIGSGGPFGAEGPIIMTGGAIGSLFAQRFHLTAAERKTLLVAGAAAGMTAIFGTPFAAILLAVEVLLFEWKPRSFVPVVTSVVVAFAWRPWVVGSGPLFPAEWHLAASGTSLLLAALVGAMTGLLACVISKALYLIEDLFHRLPLHWMWWPALGSVVVGLGALVEPRVLGAGYDTIQALVAGSLVAQAIVLLLAVKAVVWLAALGSGTSGGILAPLLIIGGAAGALAGLWLPGGSGPWAMIGMAGMMSAAMRAPLTAALFVAELTGRFDALPEAIASSGIAFGLAVLLLRRSILTEKISRRGRHISQEFSVDPLALSLARDVMTADPVTLPADLPVGEALVFFEGEAVHRSYPVVDEAGRPVALVSRADALRWRQEPGTLDGSLGETLSDVSLPVVTLDTPSDVIANLMIAENSGRVCVTDADGRIAGIVARRDLLRSRAAALKGERTRSRG